MKRGAKLSSRQRRRIIRVARAADAELAMYIQWLERIQFAQHVARRAVLNRRSA